MMRVRGYEAPGDGSIDLILKGLEAIELEQGGQMPTNCRYWTISEVAEQINVAEKTVRRLITRGELVAVKIGVSLRVPDVELRLYLERSKVVPESPRLSC